MAENHSETRSSDVHVLRDVSASSTKTCRTRSVVGGWVGVVCWCVHMYLNNVHRLKRYFGYYDQGSHSTWKTWKNESAPGKPGNIMEF